jgi:predicted DNA-binding ArsR family transcriptional regulator
MPRRTRIINDPSEMVPLLQTFRSKEHKHVFNALSTEWMTKSQLDEKMGIDTEESIDILQKCGLLESQWRMPKPGEKPDKEYHSSYSKVQANFQCSFDDLSEIITLTFTPYEEIKDLIGELEKEVESGNHSMSALTRKLNRSALYIRSLARRANRLTVMGQRLKINEEKK